MDLSIVGFAVAGWIALDAAFLGVLMLAGRRRERHVRALSSSLIATAERYTGDAAVSASPAAGLAGKRIVRGPTP